MVDQIKWTREHTLSSDILVPDHVDTCKPAKHGLHAHTLPPLCKLTPSDAADMIAWPYCTPPSAVFCLESDDPA